MQHNFERLSEANFRMLETPAGLVIVYVLATLALPFIFALTFLAIGYSAELIESSVEILRSAYARRKMTKRKTDLVEMDTHIRGFERWIEARRRSRLEELKLSMAEACQIYPEHLPLELLACNRNWMPWAAIHAEEILSSNLNPIAFRSKEQDALDRPPTLLWPREYVECAERAIQLVDQELGGKLSCWRFENEDTWRVATIRRIASYISFVLTSAQAA